MYIICTAAMSRATYFIPCGAPPTFICNTIVLPPHAFYILAAARAQNSSLDYDLAFAARHYIYFEMHSVPANKRFSLLRMRTISEMSPFKKYIIIIQMLVF